MPATFDVERFEHVAATAETALLRLSGRWRADQRERLSPPMLVVDDGRRTHRIAALPGPEDAAPLAGPAPPRWRAAFSAPVGFLEGSRVAFALDAGGGIFVDLPRPQPARRERPAPPKPAPAPRGPAAPPVDARAREEAAERARERREAMRSLEGLLAAERVARIEAERRAQQESQARQRLQTELDRQGHRTAELEAEVGRLIQSRVGAEHVARQAADDLRSAREMLEERLATERRLRAELEEAGDLRERLAAAEARLAEAGDVATALGEAHRERDDLRERLERISLERDA